LPTHIFSGSSSSLQSISAFDSVDQNFSAIFFKSYAFVVVSDDLTVLVDFCRFRFKSFVYWLLCTL